MKLMVLSIKGMDIPEASKPLMTMGAMYLLALMLLGKNALKLATEPMKISPMLVCTMDAGINWSLLSPSLLVYISSFFVSG